MTSGFFPCKLSLGLSFLKTIPFPCLGALSESHHLKATHCLSLRVSPPTVPDQNLLCPQPFSRSSIFFCYILSTHRDGSFSVLRILVHVCVLPLPRDHIPSRDLLPIPPFLQTQPSSLAEPSWPTPSSSPNFCGTRVWGLHVLPSNIHPACPCVPRLCAWSCVLPTYASKTTRCLFIHSGLHSTLAKVDAP